MFCPDCGSMMFPSEGMYTCKACNKKIEINKNDSHVIKVNSTNKDVKVLDENSTTYAKCNAICPECGHSEAYFEIRQTRAADEPETTFYRCCRCNHSWREY